MWHKRSLAWRLVVGFGSLALGYHQTMGAEATDAERIAEIKRSLNGLRETFRQERIKQCVAEGQKCLGPLDTKSVIESLEALEKAEKSGEKLCTGINISAPACTPYIQFINSLEGSIHFAAALAKDVEERRAITPSIDVGFSRDDVPEDAQPTKDVTKLTSRLKLESDSYPDDFLTEWSTDVRYSDGKLTEELTRAHVNVDHYLTPYVQAFGYVDRASDSFMSIDQRYEVGFGADWEYFQSGRRAKRRLRDYCEKSKSKDVDHGLVQSGKEAVKGFAQLCAEGVLARKSPEPLPPKGGRVKPPGENFNVESKAISLTAIGPPEFQEEARSVLKEAAAELLEIAYQRGFFYYVAHRYSRWELSTSAAVSYDSTQYSIKTIDSVSGETISISGATSLNRWSLRQSIRFRPHDKVELRLMWFWKPAFGGRAAEFEDDVRQSGTFYAEYKGGGSVVAWKPKVRYEVEYYRHNNPPTTGELLAGQSSTAVAATAISRHIVSRLTVGVEF